MTNRNLVHAMGRIDLKLIADAAPDLPQKKRKNRASWVKWSAAAVCLCLIFIGTAHIMRDETPYAPPTEYPGYTVISSFYYKGDVCENEIAAVIHKDFDDTSITLSIRKKTNDPIEVVLRGWKYHNAEVVVSHNTDLLFYVNGEKTDRIPATPGEYEVKIDYRNFLLRCDELDVMLYISDIGYFSLNGEGLKIEGIEDFSGLMMPAEAWRGSIWRDFISASSLFVMQ